MAAPQVSGLAALLKGYNSTLYNDDIENIIKLSADDRGAPGWDSAFGFGRINAGSALNLIKLPNTVSHLTSTGSTTTTSISALSAVQLFTVSGLASGTYAVKAHTVTKAVTFPTTYCNIDGVWGIGFNTTGFRLDVSGTKPIFGEGFCEVVPGTLTSTGATLRTYVYEVYTTGSVFIGYYPCAPNDVTFGYSILGKKTANVTMSIAPSLNSADCGEAAVSINTTGGSFVWTVTGDLVINGSGTTLSTTSNSIGVTGTSGTITVTGGTCPGLNISENYNPYKREVQLSGYSPLPPGDQLFVYIIGLDYTVDTFKWYVNNHLVASGINDTYCTCYGDPDYRVCGMNTVRLEAVLPCGATVVVGEMEFEQRCSHWFDYYVIYPNPASSTVYIAPNAEKMKTISSFEKEKLKEYEVSLYDIKGKLRMMAKSTDFKVELDTKNLPSNTYYLHIKMADSKELIKKQIIIKN